MVNEGSEGLLNKLGKDMFNDGSAAQEDVAVLKDRLKSPVNESTWTEGKGHNAAYADGSDTDNILQGLAHPANEKVWTEGGGHNAAYSEASPEESSARFIEAAAQVSLEQLGDINQFVTKTLHMTPESMSAYLERNEHHGNVVQNVLKAGIHAINYLRAPQNRSGKSSSTPSNLPGQSGGTPGTPTGK